MMNAAAIATAYESFIESEERRANTGPRTSVYASSWSACTRQIALDLINPPGAKQQFSTDTLANFRRGKDRARDLKADMTRVGRECRPTFDVVGAEERFELRDKKGRVVIVGKVDFRLKFDGARGAAPVEVKSYHPNLTQGVKTFEDLFQNRWTRKGAHQLLAYLLATNEPLGFMLLDRPGIPRPLEVRLFDHLDKIEDFLQRAELAMDAREDYLHAEEVRQVIPDFDMDKLPPYIDDPSECRVCPYFGSACNPPLSFDGAAIVTDEAEIQKTERLAALQDMPEIKEYAVLDKWAKKRFRGIVSAIVGKCIVTGKWQKDTKYDLTEEAEKQIEAIKAPFAKTVEQGKWFLTVTKVSE